MAAVEGGETGFAMHKEFGAIGGAEVVKARRKETRPTVVAQLIDSILDRPLLGKLVETYFEWECFAGIDFDGLGVTAVDQFEPSDLLALNLLDIRMGPEAIRAILSGTFDHYLREIPVDIDLWSEDFSEGSHPRETADALYTAIRQLPDVGPTTTSKLLARKRPRLVAIRDEVVERTLKLEGVEWWSPLAWALGDKSPGGMERRDRINHLAPMVRVSTLRRLDVAVWMVGSDSGNAKRARQEIGFE